MLGYLIVALLLAVAVYLGVGADAYVLIRLEHKALQMSIWLAVILSTFGLLALYLLWSLIRGTVLGGWRRAWTRRRMDQLQASAVKHYTDQNWAKAYKQLVKVANSHPDPQPYVIMAAEAAVAAGDIEQGRETYNRAMQQFPANSFQLKLRLAYLELGVGNHDQANELSLQLIAEKKRDPDARLLHILVAEDSGDLDAMHELLVSARNHKVLTARLPTIERRYLRACLAGNTTVPQLTKLVDMATASVSLPAEISVSLSQQLAIKGSADMAEQFLRKRIGKVWDAKLVSAYADIEGRSGKSQIKTAESWLNQHAEDKVLLQTLVKLSARSGDQARVETYEQKIAAL